MNEMIGFFVKVVIWFCDCFFYGVENWLIDEGVDSFFFYFCKMIIEVWKLGWC